MNAPNRAAVARRQHVVVRYMIITLAVTATVYACYAAYMLVWVRLSPAQFVRWLEGGILMSLGLQWLFSLVAIRLSAALVRRGI